MRLFDEPAIAQGEVMPGVSLRRDNKKTAVFFATPHRVLSSAVLNGGTQSATGFLNIRVSAGKHDKLGPPEQKIAAMAVELYGAQTVVGMMTAASMQSLRVAVATIEHTQLAVLVTSGLENARRAGDTAECRSLYTDVQQVGTINTAVISGASLSDEALVEVLTVATEAKAATLQTLGVLSPVSGEVATGTGTDATAVFCRPGEHSVRYAGKHTVLGECVAKLVMLALESSLRQIKGGGQ